MKFINIASSLLFAATATNAVSISNEFDEQVVESQLRKGKSNRNVPGTSEEWLGALNAARKTGQLAIGGTGSKLTWSNDLASQAQSWANELAKTCSNGEPSNNPGDYGVTTIVNMRNPQLAVDRWVTNGEKAVAAGKYKSVDAEPYTQILWEGTKYVGCADATSSQSGKDCTSSVCYYGLAGNCGYGKVATWEEFANKFVLSGQACSTTCPSDGTCPPL